MAKVDYAKLKALSQQMIECIGDYSEGENPDLPAPKNDVNDGGVEPNTEFLKTEESKESETGVGAAEKKKKKDASLAMMGSMLAKNLGKSKPDASY